MTYQNTRSDDLPGRMIYRVAELKLIIFISEMYVITAVVITELFNWHLPTEAWFVRSRIERLHQAIANIWRMKSYRGRGSALGQLTDNKHDDNNHKHGAHSSSDSNVYGQMWHGRCNSCTQNYSRQFFRTKSCTRALGRYKADGAIGAEILQNTVLLRCAIIAQIYITRTWRQNI
jgi:hypothetical protein